MNAAMIRRAILLAAILSPTVAGAASHSYTSAQIVSPAPGEAVRANNGMLSVEVRIAPALHPGHRVQLLLDGAAQGRPQGAFQFHLVDLDRGAHELQVQVLDAAGQVVFTGEPSLLYLHRHSRLHQGAAQPP